MHASLYSRAGPRGAGPAGGTVVLGGGGVGAVGVRARRGGDVPARLEPGKHDHVVRAAVRHREPAGGGVERHAGGDQPGEADAPGAAPRGGRAVALRFRCGARAPPRRTRPWPPLPWRHRRRAIAADEGRGRVAEFEAAGGGARGEGNGGPPLRTRPRDSQGGCRCGHDCAGACCRRDCGGGEGEHSPRLRTRPRTSPRGRPRGRASLTVLPGGGTGDCRGGHRRLRGRGCADRRGVRRRGRGWRQRGGGERRPPPPRRPSVDKSARTRTGSGDRRCGRGHGTAAGCVACVDKASSAAGGGSGTHRRELRELL